MQSFLSSDADPTFFEVITSTIVSETLADRFIEAVRSLKSSKLAEHDLLIASCYLYACRIPISVDIATAFLRPFGLNVIEISEMLLSMGRLLSAYEGTFAESSQSYYVPRSRQVSEVVIDRIPSTDLRRVLEVFHSEVSPTKIGRYDVFRRGAYDASLISRAFPDWQDGLEFYKLASLRDVSHSLKQQGALYLSRKDKHELAFSWIDEAKSLAGNNNAAMRNSYAVIMFSANFEKVPTPEVINSLDESMEMLRRCYTEDHRKVYHAKVFSHQAIKYSKKFPKSPNSLIYLDASDKWLSAELTRRIGDRKMIQLQRQITSARRFIQI
jgi:hypothetical protein